MKLIVGLGNPSLIYKYSRHNIGSLLIDRLARDCGIKLRRDSGLRSCLGKGRIDDKQVILARPLCFMNLAGTPVKLLLREYNLDPQQDLLVVFDDLDLEWGRIRIRPAGSSGGHRGVKSIIESLGSSGFARLRMGIGRPLEAAGRLDKTGKRQRVVNYVLRGWSGREKEQLAEYLQRAADCCLAWAAYGTSRAMNKFN
jgi:PTH1 family peptidyl-tRNA hydrolase